MQVSRCFGARGKLAMFERSQQWREAARVGLHIYTRDHTAVVIARTTGAGLCKHKQHNTNASWAMIMINFRRMGQFSC